MYQSALKEGKQIHQAKKQQSGFAGYKGNQQSSKSTTNCLDWTLFLQSMHMSLLFGSLGRTPSQYLQTQALNSPSLHVCHQTCVHFYNNSYVN